MVSSAAAASVQVHVGSALLVSSIQQLETNSGRQLTTHFALQKPAAARVNAEKEIVTILFFSQVLEAALPYLALQRDLPASSPSTSGAFRTLAAPQLLVTQHHGVPHRPTPMASTSLESMPGDTALPLALFKVRRNMTFCALMVLVV